jgi:hypothetical protein
LGGDWNSKTRVIERGWPWVYEQQAEINVFSKNANWKIWFQRNKNVQTLSYWIPWANGAIAILIACCVGFCWEWRVRQLKHWLQFTLREWLFFCALFGGVYVSGYWMYRDNQTEKELQAILTVHNIQMASIFNFKNEPEDVIARHDADVPCDWQNLSGCQF